VIQSAISSLFALGLFATASAVADVPPLLRLSACQLEHPLKIAAVAAECGILTVPENPAAPGGRQIGLRVARVRAINRRKQPDPLFILAGGPGMAATVFYVTAAGAFERIHRNRDVVLIDQRGTGESNPLDCELSEEKLAHASADEVAVETRQCLTALAARADVRFYTTSLAVQDLDRVRAVLGYQRINLYGVSYGTRVAQHYVRRFPQRARAVILDGVVPVQLALGPRVALDAEQALTRILARCASEPDCSRHFGDPSRSYQTLRELLERRSVPVSLADPTTGEPSRIDFTRYHLATVLRLASYTSEQAALLPLSLHSAQQGDFTSLAAQFLFVNRSYGRVVAFGMHNSVVCAEDVPFYDSVVMDRSRLAQTYLGTSQVDGLREICKVWPRGPLDDDFHAPFRTDVPALLLSGSDDPITPAANAEEARGEFEHSVHVVLEGFGHGQLTAPCVDGIMARFVDRGGIEGLDVSCVRTDKPLPFFTTLNGPPP